MRGMKLLIHSQSSTVAPLKFVNGDVITSHTLHAWLLLTLARIKVNPECQMKYTE